jgi:hypothetical protein
MNELFELYKENLFLLDKLIELEIGGLTKEELEKYEDDMIELKELKDDKEYYQTQIDNFDKFKLSSKDIDSIMEIMKSNNRNYKLVLDIRGYEPSF